MPRQRPSPPRSSAYANAPKVQDPDVARAIAPLVADMQTLQREGASVLVDGTRPPQLGNDAAGDLWYLGSDGKLARLPAGADGQVLTMVSGRPAWA